MIYVAFYTSAADLSEEDYAIWVYTEGSSPLLPALHAILGLRSLDGISGPLQEHWKLQGAGKTTLKRRERPPLHAKEPSQFPAELGELHLREGLLPQRVATGAPTLHGLEMPCRKNL